MRRSCCPAIVAAALTLLAASASATQVLKIFVEPDPPFVLLHDGKPAGPYLEALRALLAGQNLSLQVTLMPQRRISAMLPNSPGSCGLAINFSPGEAETLSFVGRVAPVKLAVYALKGAPSVRNIEDLRPHRVGAVDTADVRDLLGAADIAFEPVAPTAQRTGMLLRKRFDYLVSDERPGMLDGDSGSQVQRVFVLTRVDRWMACHAGLPPALLAALRLALQEGLFAESVQPIWARAGLRLYYQAVRSEWELIPRSPASAPRRPGLPP